jgi:hypothetical protein
MSVKTHLPWRMEFACRDVAVLRQNNSFSEMSTLRKFGDRHRHLCRPFRTAMVKPATLSQFIAMLDRNCSTIKSCRLRGCASIPATQDGIGEYAWFSGKSRMRVISSVFGRSSAVN